MGAEGGGGRVSGDGGSCSCDCGGRGRGGGDGGGVRFCYLLIKMYGVLLLLQAGPDALAALAHTSMRCGGCGAKMGVSCTIVLSNQY